MSSLAVANNAGAVSNGRLFTRPFRLNFFYTKHSERQTTTTTMAHATFGTWLPAQQSPRGCELEVWQPNASTRLHGVVYASNQLEGVHANEPLCVTLSCGSEFVVAPHMRCGRVDDHLGTFAVLPRRRVLVESPAGHLAPLVVSVVLAALLWRLIARPLKQRGRPLLRQSVPLDAWEWRAQLQ